MTERPPELQELLDRGHARIQRDQEERERRAAAELAEKQAAADNAWLQLAVDTKAVLPEALHPYITIERPEDEPTTRPHRDGYTVSLCIPGLSRIKFSMFRPYNTEPLADDGYCKHWQRKNGYELVKYYIGQPYTLGENRYAVGQTLSHRIEDLCLALAGAEHWEQERARLEAEAAEKNAEHEAEAEKWLAEQERDDPLPSPTWRKALDMLDAELDRSEASDSPVATQAAIACGLKALVEYLAANH